MQTLCIIGDGSLSAMESVADRLAETTDKRVATVDHTVESVAATDNGSADAFRVDGDVLLAAEPVLEVRLDEEVATVRWVVRLQVERIGRVDTEQVGDIPGREHARDAFPRCCCMTHGAGLPRVAAAFGADPRTLA